MANESEEKQLGIFWGNHSISFVETDGMKPKKVFSVPITTAETEDNLEEKSEEAPEEEEEQDALNQTDKETIKSIKKILKKNKIESPLANLSLPAKDIIFRSFTLPWMPASEIKGVVEFEASKYIPFELEELAFTYHSIPTATEDSKQLRVVFVAIRKDTLSKYTKILEEASLEVFTIEPAPLSLIRALTLKDFISQEQTIALIEYDDGSGKIIIIDNGIPLFVREFQLRTQADTDTETKIDNATMLARLTNEIKISLDYFNRQEGSLSVEEIIFLATSDVAQISETIESVLNITTTPMQNESLLEIYADKETDFLNAFGAGLVDTVALPVEFNLGTQTKRKRKKDQHLKAAMQVNYKPVIATALVCIPLIALTVFFTNPLISKPQQRLSKLDEDLGPHSDVEQLSVERDNIKIERKLNHIKNVRIESNVSHFLAIVPTLLPKGAWLKDFEIMYIVPKEESDLRRTKTKKKKLIEKKISKPLLKLSGYAYLENTKSQFQLINNFLNNLKADENFTETFKSITLKNVDTQKIEEYAVTFFEINCQ